MHRFVILEHDHPMLHWDLLLEQGAVLRSWRLLSAPEQESEIAAERTADHRPLYLDYEGPVSGNRGRVRRWDFGTYAVEEEHEEQLQLRVDGVKLKGKLLLQKRGTEWTFLYCNPRMAR